MVIENILFSCGGGALLGYLAGKAIKVVAKIAMIIVGLFILGLAFLSYKGLVNVNWVAVENQTRSAAVNATTTVMHVVNDTATKFTVHPGVLETQALPIAAIVGFLPGFAMGIKH